MKKTIATMIAILIFSTIAICQHSYVNRLEKQTKINDQYIHNIFVDKILKKQMKDNIKVRNSLNKTTVEIAERLIAFSSYNFDTTLPYGLFLNNYYGLCDSSQYKYSSARSSLFNYNHMNFDPVYYVDGYFPMGYGGDIGFPDKNNQPSILFDSAWIWGVDDLTFIISDTFKYRGMQYVIYDSNNNITDYATIAVPDTTSSNSSMRYINLYDINSNIILSQSFTFNTVTSSWDTSGNRILFYDVNNRIIKDSTISYGGMGFWISTEMWHYNYDDSGNIIYAVFSIDSTGMGTWYDFNRYNMSYYPNNNLFTDSQSQFKNGIWSCIVKDTFGYTSGVNYVTYQRSLFYNFDTLTDNWLYTKNINISGLPDTMYFSEWVTPLNRLQMRYKIGYTYDSYDEPIIATQFNFKGIDSTGSGWYDTVVDGITYYYYELYDKIRHNGVQSVPPPCTAVNIFPNPAQQAVNVQISGIDKGANIQLTLLNVAGQKVITENLPWLRETERFSIAGLPSGVYWLLVQDKAGNTLGKQQLVKE